MLVMMMVRSLTLHVGCLMETVTLLRHHLRNSQVPMMLHGAQQMPGRSVVPDVHLDPADVAELARAQRSMQEGLLVAEDDYLADLLLGF